MKTKRKTYPGSIYPDRGNLYIEFKGKRTSTGLKDTALGRKRAEQILENIFLQYHRIGELQPERRILINDAFDEFMKTKVNIIENSKETYYRAKKTIISGNYYIYLENIEKDIQNYIARTKHGPVMVNKNINHLQFFLDYCHKKDWLKKANFNKVYKKNETQEVAEPFTNEECIKLYKYFLKKDLNIAYMLRIMLDTGARTVDCLNLEKQNIRLNIIDGYSEVIWKNKITKEPERRPIMERTARIFNKLLEINHDKPVFGVNYSKRYAVSHKLKEAMEYLKIEQKSRSWQEFRITYRMKLLNLGVQKEYVEWLLRHSSGKIIDKHYTHFEGKEIIEKIEKMVREK